MHVNADQGWTNGLCLQVSHVPIRTLVRKIGTVIKTRFQIEYCPPIRIYRHPISLFNRISSLRTSRVIVVFLIRKDLIC